MIKKSIYLSVAVCALSCFFMITALLYGGKSVVKNQFIQPGFENDYETGNPYDKLTPEEKKNWLELISAGMSYKTHILDNIYLDNSDYGKVYFTNEDTNKNVLLKIRVLNGYNEVVAETGLIKPGEYIEKVKFRENTDAGSYKIKIMSYEPTRYYSMGAVIIDAKLNHM